ncbi:PREDICTED: 3-oxoacyl-[acyl-carrier-protein] reductase FabG-like [Nicrophorus vespilloides]|uniref:3-oxoacyl-[acyl-carrier-protein] reductase FabG-like n=1 Tax=Nicrophorus vespilloides TaxID=110193 RepID=A0ABM1N310_NICVS|nr:PREDICTED: 3-oxoacyl-[acyl-carrier-protein] reductase FabG-like [Nicrophorus vespilloides]
MALKLPFAGKVVLITGACSGIGAATAQLFSRSGACLFMCGQNKDNLAAVADKCIQKPETFIGDLTCDDDIRDIIKSTIKTFGKLDVLLNVAGILESGNIENLDLCHYDRTMAINTKAVYHLSSLAAPHLIKTKGCIVSVSSVVGIRSFPNVLAYCMSKAAVDHFTRCAALELGPKQVRVNCVNPGMIVTNLHKSGGMSEEAYEKFKESAKNTHALGRAGQPEEVAAAMHFLASDDASFITGVSLSVDGGKHAMCPR